MGHTASLAPGESLRSPRSREQLPRQSLRLQEPGKLPDNRGITCPSWNIRLCPSEAVSQRAAAASAVPGQTSLIHSALWSFLSFLQWVWQHCPNVVDNPVSGKSSPWSHMVFTRSTAEKPGSSPMDFIPHKHFQMMFFQSLVWFCWISLK